MKQMRPKRMQKGKQTYVFMSSGRCGSLNPTKSGRVKVKILNVKFHWNPVAGFRTTRRIRQIKTETNTGKKVCKFSWRVGEKYHEMKSQRKKDTLCRETDICYLRC
jgi:hypothetical protein